MAEGMHISAKDAVFKLQLRLLDGIQQEKQLLSAGSLLARQDYKDVVTERSISNVCGYPLCSNPLPSDRSTRGRYRISLNEHRVYDLWETTMFCSSECLINSRAFAASLKNERSSDLQFVNAAEVLRRFEGLSLRKEQKRTQNLGPIELNLKIMENEDAGSGEISLEKWIGPATAVEGYVPQHEQPMSRTSKKAAELSGVKHGTEKTSAGGTDFRSSIITDMLLRRLNNDKRIGQNSTSAAAADDNLGKQSEFEKIDASFSQETAASKGSAAGAGSGQPVHCMSLSAQQNEVCLTTSAKLSKPEGSLSANSECTAEPHSFSLHTLKCSVGTEMDQLRKEPSLDVVQVEDGKTSSTQLECLTGLPRSNAIEEAAGASETTNNALEPLISQNLVYSMDCKVNAIQLKPSLRIQGTVTRPRKVTWADEMKNKVPTDGSFCNRRDDIADQLGSPAISSKACNLASNESIESPFNQATEMTTLKEYVCISAEAESLTENGRDGCMKWTNKHMVLDADAILSENVWHDSPPEGFDLTLSGFSRIWMAIFEWVTSSSLAYIYGKSESDAGEFSCIKGREYPYKTVLSGGRSMEIQQTLASCISRVLLEVVTKFKISVPVSFLEMKVGCLLDTMSFTSALPPFRRAQWHVIVLLFLEALSVCKIPTLAHDLTSMLLQKQKILEAAQIRKEEFEVMKDLYIPLDGRALCYEKCQ